jgi:predicted  nucleic acid-binding Zn-ribbon protein
MQQSDSSEAHRLQPVGLEAKTMSSAAQLFRQLHHLLGHSANLRTELDGAPKKLQAHKDRLAKQEQELKDYQENTRKLKVAIMEKESALKSKNQQIEKYEGQVNLVSSKKEFDALKHEIANTKQECSKLEDEILHAMTEVDGRTAQVPKLEKDLEEAKKKTAQLIDEIQTRRNQYTDQLAEAQKQVADLEANLPPEFLAQYQRERNARGEDSLAAVVSKTCQACYTTLTEQNYNNLLSGRLVLCKSCGRILYLPD